MKKYKTHKVIKKDIKYFSITLGLNPGYTLTKNYGIEEVLDFYKKIIKEKIIKGQNAFPVRITPCHFVYGFLSDSNIICNNENAILIEGEIIKEYHKNIFTDDELLLENILKIAGQLGNKFKQKRIHVVFQDTKYILE